MSRLDDAFKDVDSGAKILLIPPNQSDDQREGVRLERFRKSFWDKLLGVTYTCSFCGKPVSDGDYCENACYYGHMEGKFVDRHLLIFHKECLLSDGSTLTKNEQRWQSDLLANIERVTS